MSLVVHDNNTFHPSRQLSVPSNVHIDQSNDVYFGERNVFHGPVTIEKVVVPVPHPGTTLNDDGDDGNRTDWPVNKATSVDSNTKEATKEKTISAYSKNGSCLGQRSRCKLIVIVSISLVFISFIIILSLVFTAVAKSKGEYDIVLRAEWGAMSPSNKTTPLVTPVPYIIIHHTATESCSTKDECIRHVQFIQKFHIGSRGFFDIAYNFLVGGDGTAFEGRGWTVEGSHSYGYNFKSMGLAFIGTFNHMKPTERQVAACKAVMEKGVELGFIKRDYKLLGARQLAGTESPGAELFAEMKTWPHWSEEP